jgi:hypothetical protein
MMEQMFARSGSLNITQSVMSAKIDEFIKKWNPLVSDWLRLITQHKKFRLLILF